MTQDSLTGNGHAASPRHFHDRTGPVYGLARTWRAAFPCATRAQWPGVSIRSGAPLARPRSLTVAGAAQALRKLQAISNQLSARPKLSWLIAESW